MHGEGTLMWRAPEVPMARLMGPPLHVEAMRLLEFVHNTPGCTLADMKAALPEVEVLKRLHRLRRSRRVRCVPDGSIRSTSKEYYLNVNHTEYAGLLGKFRKQQRVLIAPECAVAQPRQVRHVPE
jgi:hypothetical protein